MEIEKKHKLNIAFDIDDTIWKIRMRTKDGRRVGDQVPDYDLINVLRWFYNNGDNIYVWSAGGTDYAYTICEKLGIDEMVKILPKPPLDGNNPKIDLTFDDSEIGLGKVNCLVNRKSYEQQNSKS